MADDYLLLEDGSKLILEDGTGNLILESSTEDISSPGDPDLYSNIRRRR